MRIRYWVSNLENDEGEYAANGDELDRLVHFMLITGIKVENIGIVPSLVENKKGPNPVKG